MCTGSVAHWRMGTLLDVQQRPEWRRALRAPMSDHGDEDPLRGAELLRLAPAHAHSLVHAFWGQDKGCVENGPACSTRRRPSTRSCLPSTVDQRARDVQRVHWFQDVVPSTIDKVTLACRRGQALGSSRFLGPASWWVSTPRAEGPQALASTCERQGRRHLQTLLGPAFVVVAREVGGNMLKPALASGINAGASCQVLVVLMFFGIGVLKYEIACYLAPLRQDSARTLTVVFSPPHDFGPVFSDHILSFPFEIPPDNSF